MKLHLSGPTAYNQFSGYGAGYVAVNGTQYTRSLVVLPDQTYEGLAQDIDEHGSLIVDGTVVSAGSLIHL